MLTFKSKQSKYKFFLLSLFFRTMDNWIGRTAHIKLLDSDAFLNLLVVRYKPFFE